MSDRKLIGEIVHKDGWICLKCGKSTWYPLDGNSWTANRFREEFGVPSDDHVGLLLYRTPDGLHLEDKP